MSTFLKKITNPKTNKKQIAVCLDDFYGNHQYVYVFKKDGTDFTWRDFANLKDCDYYVGKDDTTEALQDNK